MNNPNVRDYFVARALRILPGFYICLLVTAFVIAPVSVAIRGGSAKQLILSGAPLEYVLKNAAVAFVKFDVGGTPTGIPDAGDWDASLWSLIWEVMCYLIVGVIGVVGLASRRWVSPAILALATVGALLMPAITFPEVLHHPGGDARTALIFLACRTAIMFSAGALLYQWRDAIPARWSLVAASVVVVILAGQLPDYRVIAAVPLAYAIVVSGTLLQHRRLRLRTDISYGMYIYAYPVQQLLAVSGLFNMNRLLIFSVVSIATVPLAFASWFLVEKPARSLKHRFAPKRSGADKQPLVALPPDMRGMAH